MAASKEQPPLRGMNNRRVEALVDGTFAIVIYPTGARGGCTTC